MSSTFTGHLKLVESFTGAKCHVQPQSEIDAPPATPAGAALTHF
jgi:hypothetical protein